MRILLAIPFLLFVNTLNAEPVLFDRISLLCTVPEIDFYDPSEVDYMPTEDFAGCPESQEITGTGGLVEVFYGVPEGGGPEPAFPPQTISFEEIDVLARIGTATYMDFDPPPSVLAAHSSGSIRSLALCSDGTTRLANVDPGPFTVDCDGWGIPRVRFITRPNEAVNLSTLSAIEVPEPTLDGGLIMLLTVITGFVLNRGAP